MSLSKTYEYLLACLGSFVTPFTLSLHTFLEPSYEIIIRQDSKILEFEEDKNIVIHNYFFKENLVLISFLKVIHEFY